MPKHAKWAKAKDDPELFATFRVLASEHSQVSSAHVAFVLGRIHAIVVDGVTAGDFTAGDPETTATAVLDATSRFHAPVHASEWSSPEIEAQAEAVIALILNGLRAR